MTVGDDEHDQPGHGDGRRAAEHPEQHALDLRRPARAGLGEQEAGREQDPQRDARSTDRRGSTDHNAETSATESSAPVAIGTARGSRSPSRR